jgi:hypothetical protein
VVARLLYLLCQLFVLALLRRRGLLDTVPQAHRYALRFGLCSRSQYFVYSISTRCTYFRLSLWNATVVCVIVVEILYEISESYKKFDRVHFTCPTRTPP